VTDLSEWLSRTTEAALEPELPICDPHHHLWEFPDSRYLTADFLADADGGHRLTQTVFVECLQHYRSAGPEPLRPVGETEFVARLAAESDRAGHATRVAAAIVAFADLTLGDAVEDVLLAHLAASPRVRGVRYATAWDSSDRIRRSHTNPPKELLATREFRAGFARLQRLGLTFDAWLYHPQIPELADLARAFPDAAIVLDHMGGPLGIGPYAGDRAAVFAAWRQHMAELARCPNVVVKLGGRTMTMSGFGWHKRAAPPGSSELADAMGPYFRACIEHFGAARCMFESNFPVDRASCSYTVLWNAFKRLTGGYSQAERAALFQHTAARVYGLGP
jgi:L-fuconolactonase